MFVYLFVCLSDCLPVNLSDCSFVVCLSLSVCLFVCLVARSLCVYLLVLLSLGS